MQRYALHGVRVETRCEGGPDLASAIEAVLTYFGLTRTRAGQVQGSVRDPNRRDLDETHSGLVESGGPPEVRLAFHAEGPSLRAPEQAELALSHNGVQVWRCGEILYLREGSSWAELHPARGTARGVIATSPWRDRKELEGSSLGGANLLLRLGFVNLVLHTLLLLLKRRAFFPLHAAALAPEENRGGVLLVARSDSGKSTQALGLVRAGWGFLSDDSLLIHPTGESIEALPLRREFGLDEEAAGDFPEVTRYWRPFLTEECKRRVDMQALYPGRALTRCAPQVLLFPEITRAQQSRLEPMGRSEALLGLISQSPLLSADRETTPAHLEAFRRLTLQARAFRLRAGRDLKDTPELLSGMLTPLLP